MSIEARSRQYGKVFDHWQIREFLGSGSGGKTAVFRMTRVDSDRGASALKVVNLIEERGNPDALSGFRKQEYEAARAECSKNAEREVWLMDELRGNTNIVDYLDHTFVDWSDESGFGRDLLIRMELLKDLRSELRSGRIFSEEEVLKVGRDICTALILCHRKNILHRDVKPENIFCNKDGNYKLGDFGVSRVLDACPGAVASTGIGTYEYWPAEQMTGRYDTRVDTYSLGLVLYELSNRNRLPFAASAYATGREVSLRLAGTELPAPCDASPALARVILKACAFDPNDRFPNAEAFLRALHHVSSRGTVRKEPEQLPRNYSTAPAAVRPTAGSEARRAAMEALAEADEEPTPAPIRKKGLGKLWIAVVLMALGILAAGWGLASLIFGGTPDTPLPEEPALAQPLPTEAPETTAAPETAAVPETTLPEEPPVPVTTAPETEPPETEPVKQAMQMAEEGEMPIVGVVNSLDNGVNIRSAPGTDANILGEYKSGTTVEIWEIVDSKGARWGRTEDGWICMTYVDIMTGEVLHEGPKEIRYTGKVIRTDELNVRAAASTSADIITTLQSEASLVIYETVISEGMAWGRCDAGWVYLYYVDLNPVGSDAVDARVVYNDNTVIYKDANMSEATSSVYAKMTVVEIFEIIGKMARTELGWVNIDNLL